MKNKIKIATISVVILSLSLNLFGESGQGSINKEVTTTPTESDPSNKISSSIISDKDIELLNYKSKEDPFFIFHWGEYRNDLSSLDYKILPKESPEMKMSLATLMQRREFAFPLERRMTHYDYFNQQDTIKELYDLYQKYNGKGLIRAEWMRRIGPDPNYRHWVIVYSQKNDTLVPEVGIIYKYE